MRILFLAHLFPLPLDSGGKMKSFYTLKALTSKHDVSVLAYLRESQENKHIDELKRICADIEVVWLKRGKLRQIYDLAAGSVPSRSFIIGRDFRTEMQQAFRKSVEHFKPDVVHVDHLQMAQFVDYNASYKIVLDHHNVESAIIKRLAETSDSPGMRLFARIEWPKLQHYELNVCSRSSLVLAVSEEDQSALRKLNPELVNIRSVPIGVDTEYFTPVQRRTDSKNLLSIGTMHWPPNIDSMLFFCREVYPLIRKQAPECTLTIAGQKPTQAIQALASDPAIRVTGYVDDARLIAQDCGAFIVPLRSGSGVRVKILNAMAMGLPIVSTSIGAEGLDVVSGKHLILADDREQFAQAVVKVLMNRELALSLGENARNFVCERYAWDIIGKRLLSVYDEELTGQTAR